MFDKIKIGSRVTIRVPAGLRLDGTHDTVERTGRAVIASPGRWALNMGGAHGTPGVATRDNVVAVGGRRA